MLCEPVEPPAGELEHIHYFCGNTEIPESRSSASIRLNTDLARKPRDASNI
jgi:type I restriction enzyme R subunit